MSWSDTEYLELMHNCNTGHDIGAGMVVFHCFPIDEEAEENHCYLNWFGHAAEPEVRRVLEESKLQWMVGNTEESELAWMVENTEVSRVGTICY